MNQEIVEQSDECSIPVFIIRPERLDIDQVWRHISSATDIIVLTFFLDTVKMGDN